MGLFGRNKNKEFEDGHNNDLFTDDDDFITPIQNRSRFGEGRVTAPHALTADEVTGTVTENIPMKSDGVRRSNSVYESMKEHEKKPETTGFDDDYVPSWVTPSGSFAPQPDMSAFSDRPKADRTAEDTAEAAKRAEEILKSTNVRTEKTVSAEDDAEPIHKKEEIIPEPYAPETESAAAFLERCRIAVMGAAHDTALEQGTEEVPMFSSASKPQETASSAPAKEEDFESIVRRLKGELEGTASVAEHNEPTAPFEEVPAVQEVSAVSPSPETAEDSTAATQAEEPVPPAEEPSREVKVEVEVIPEDSPAEIMHTASLPTIPPVPAAPVVPIAPAGDVKIYGRVIHGKVIQQTPDGDIDVAELIKAKKEAEAAKAAEEMEATRMFDGLDDIISQKAEDSFNVSREVYEDEYDDEDDEEHPYYETEDTDLEGIDEYNDLNDAARLRTRNQAERSVNSVKTGLSFLLTFLMLLISLPIMDLLPVTAGGVISLLLLIAAIGVNFDIFKEFKHLAKTPGFDCCVTLVALAAAVQTAVSTFVYDGQYALLAAAAGLLLSVNRAVKLSKIKRIGLGLEKIATSETKNAVKLAEKTASKVMASGAVEGEVVGLAAQPAVNIGGFMKSSHYKSPFDLKAKVLLLVGLLVSVAAGVAAGILGGAGAGITMGTAMLCCCYPACAVLSAEMPLNRITRRLAEHGAVMAGFKGAYDLNLANVVAVSTSDLFPEGSVKLYNMKTLGENEIGQTLTAAAAVAFAADSPLAGVFRDMVGVSSEKDLPKVNGVQYEDKMGISGWIGDNTVLIGNRNLMQGHNIAVPPAAVDQKILKAGYFPVYIACKGVPCLLFIVKYEVDPEIRDELKKLCNTGMTVVVDPQDPNASDAMICDYFGIPDDALKTMNHNGRVMYQRQSAPAESVTAPAAYGKRVTGMFAAVTAGITLRSTLSVLTAVYIIAAVLGGVLLMYLGVLGKLSLITSAALIIFQAVFMLISIIVLKVKDRQ